MGSVKYTQHWIFSHGIEGSADFLNSPLISDFGIVYGRSMNLMKERKLFLLCAFAPLTSYADYRANCILRTVLPSTLQHASQLYSYFMTLETGLWTSKLLLTSSNQTALSSPNKNASAAKCTTATALSWSFAIQIFCGAPIFRCLGLDKEVFALLSSRFTK